MKAWRWLISGIVLIACALIWAVQGHPTSDKTESGYEALLGDLDGDGDIDALLTAGGRVSSPANTIWINQGGLQGKTQGKFSPSIQQIGDQDSRAVRMGDLDNDGDLDMLIGKDRGFEVYINNGGQQGGWRGNFQRQASKQQFDAVGELRHFSLGDLDDDGDLDALFGLCCGALAYHTAWLNDGNVFFTNTGPILGEARSRELVLGDLDGDDDLDVVMLVENQNTDSEGLSETSMQIWLNHGNGHFTNSGQRLGHGQVRSIALGDLDGDNDLDAITQDTISQASVTQNTSGHEAVSIWMNDGTGRFTNSAQMTGQLAAQTIRLGDLDQDRDLDALLSSGDTAEVWMNDGRGGFELSAQLIDLTWYSAVALGDLDGDGDLDLFSGYLDKRYRIWWNDGFGRLGLSWR